LIFYYSDLPNLYHVFSVEGLHHVQLLNNTLLFILVSWCNVVFCVHELDITAIVWLMMCTWSSQLQPNFQVTSAVLKCQVQMSHTRNSITVLVQNGSSILPKIDSEHSMAVTIPT
jgi:hypothetical protein